MKHKIFALVLALTVASWAQTATQTPSTPQPGSTQADKASCACCDKMSASAKDGEKSCQRHSMKAADGKDMASCCAGKDKEMSCCGGKDSKSCMKGDKATASCCKDGCAKDKTAAACCGTSDKACGKGCCSSDKKEKTAKNCCGHAVRS